MHLFTVMHMETAILLLVKKKLRKLERHIAHLKYRMSIISEKSLNNLLDVSKEEAQKELEKLQNELNDSENQYHSDKFQFNCIRYTMVAVIAMMFYILITYHEEIFKEFI